VISSLFQTRIGTRTIDDSAAADRSTIEHRLRLVLVNSRQRIQLQGMASTPSRCPLGRGEQFDEDIQESDAPVRSRGCTCGRWHPWPALARASAGRSRCSCALAYGAGVAKALKLDHSGDHRLQDTSATDATLTRRNARF